MRFHRKCGDRVTLLNENTTAVRNFVEFNHGLVLSAEPLEDDVPFEVSIDRKVNVWNGSLEIGVTTIEPNNMELPATATKLRNTAWIMSGRSVVKDGVTLVSAYGPELDTLREGDSLAVMKSSKGELIYYINNRSLGVAAKDLPSKVFAVVDLYGQCVQVSIINSNATRSVMDANGEQVAAGPNNDDSTTESDVAGAVVASTSMPNPPQDVYVPMEEQGACALVVPDPLRFHIRCGILIVLSCNNKTAERVRPLDDYNNGVVMTHRPLHDNELFEVRVDKLVDKWSGSIEMGVTTHNPATMRFPSTMTNMESGTIMMSGCKVLVNGHGTNMEFGNFNLDDLREGDSVGMMRKCNGKLHYFINGVDQGVASDKVAEQIWGVVDLYGMTVKVTIIDRSSDSDSNVGNIPQASLASPETPGPSMPRAAMDEETLLFHTLRDSNVIIVNNGTTAHRPSAFEIFSNGVVMTNRTLRTNELFEVRIDLIIPKWAGGIEIGVTQQNPNDIELPCNLSSGQSGTWAVVGSDVIRDGTVIIPQYVRNLNKLAEGDTVGVVRKGTGILHLYVNGEDQGPAAFNIPKNVYGVIDLYGKVAQATIVKSFTPPPMDSPESPLSTESNATIYPDMCFHRVHGQNAQLSRNRLTATRSTVYSEFNDAVLFSCRPLRESDMFEIRIDKMVDCWIGSLEIGVTAIKPDDLEATGVGAVAGTATDLCWDTYILSGAAMMKDGECVRSGYPLDLDTLTVGSRVGMMWHTDRSLHFYLDGMDMGKAWHVPNLNIYAVVDLYGQCTQVTLLQNQERTFNSNGLVNSDNSLLTNSRALPSPPTPYWSFSEYCGDNVNLLNGLTVARRRRDEPTSTLVFSSSHLAVEEIFEIEILNCKHGYAGSFRMGMTGVNILNANVNRTLPPTLAGLPHYTTYIDGRYMKYTKPNGSDRDIYSFVPSFEWLRPGDRIGFKKTKESNVHVYYNSELLDFAFEKVPDKVYVVMELSGHVTEIQAVSRTICVAHVQIQSGPNDECNQNELAQDPNDTALPDNPLSQAQEGESAVATDVYESRNEEYGYQQYPYVPQTQEYASQNYTTMPQNEAHGHNYGYMTQNGACGYQNFVPLPQNGTYACQNCVPITQNEACALQYCPTLAQNATCAYHNNAGVSQNLAGCIYHETYPVAPHSGAYGYQNGCAVVPHNEAFTLQHCGYVSQNAACGYQNCVSVPQNPACGYQCCANIPQNGYPACGVPVSHNVPCGYPNYVAVPQNGVYPYQPINQYVGVNQPEAYAYPNCVSYPQSDGYGYQNRAGITQEQYAYQNTTNMSHNETYGYPNYPAMQQTEVMGYQDCPTITQPEALTYPDYAPGSQDEALTYPDYVPGSQDEALTYPDYLPGSQNERLTYPNYVPGSQDEAYGYQDYAPVSENEFEFQNETYESENAVAVPEDSGSQYGDENPPEISESKTPEIGEDEKDNDIPVAEVTEENQEQEVEQQDREVEQEQEKEVEQEQEEEVEQELDEEVEQEQEEEVEQEQKEVEQEYEKEIKQNIEEQVEQVEVLESDEIETPTESTSSELPVATSTAESAKPPLPYTFHFVHGKNVKLCSSDTVAFRTKGYNGAIAIVSQPLKRGNRFRFRVDKMTENWSGSVTIGGVGTLPMEPLPDYAMHVDPPVWLVSSDMLNDNGRFSPTESACELDNIREQSVLTVLFNYNGDLMLDIDGVVSFVIANVPQIYNQIFPLIDLYGRVSQVSALLHPHVVTSGASLDLPMINEGNRNNRADELETVEQDGTSRNAFSLGRRFTLKPNAYSQSNFVEDPMLAQPGPSSRPDPLPILNVPDDIENANREIKNRKVPNRLSLHASLIFTDGKTFSDDDGASNLRVQKSYSTFSFRDVANRGTNESLRYAYNANTSSGRYNRLREQLSDTNIRHNDRYPEANDVDNLDNEIMDALTLETGNLPDLTEEHSSSLDDSTRHDDITSVTLTIANLNYLNRILCFDQDGVDGQSLESEWEASGEGCEHLHLVLKYWNFLVGPYPELRKAVSWGQVRCYCNNCQPDSRAPFAGWVRIERIDGVGAAQRGFWHVTQETLGSAQANSSERGPPRRPRTLTNNPRTSLSYSDVWYDEEGKPHQTILSIEIDIEGSDAENDRLLAFLIYLKPNMVQSDYSPTAEE